MSDLFRKDGKIIKVVANGKYEVELTNGHVITAHVSGKIGINHIRILAGDSVIVEMSKYDLLRGRIVYRNNKKTQNNIDRK